MVPEAAGEADDSQVISGEENVPSQKIDELLGAGFRSDDVRQGERLQYLVCNSFAAAHIGGCIGC